MMPAAHAFLQVRGEGSRLIEGLTTEQIWMRVGGSASIGFHALHAADQIATLRRIVRS